MKRKIYFVVLMAVVLLVSQLFAGCFGKTGVVIDKNKTQLYVSVYNGGTGDAWLQRVARNFEKEPGNEKIQVVVKPAKIEYGTIRDEMIAGTSEYDMYFSDGVKMNELIYLGLVEDLTDVMLEKIQGEEESIFDKMSSEQKNAMGVGSASEKKYYSIPYQVTPSGIVYDHDLFSNYGILDDGVGPDGKSGTYDDGLPATYQDFKAMLALMTQSGIVPFTFTGEYEFYTGFTYRAIWAQYEGMENYALNYSFNGVDSNLGEITPQTGYKLFQQQGLKQAMIFAEECLSKAQYVHENSFKGKSHTVAQNEFILSEKTTNPIGMILTGSWWENESRGTFMSAYNEYGQRDFRMLPLPKFDGQKGFKEDGGGSMMFNWNDDTSIFIKKSSKQKELAKEFLKYVNSDKSMEIFTIETNCVRALDYQISTEAFNKLTKFGQNVWTICNDKENIKIVGKQSSSPLINFTSPPLDNYRFDSVINNFPYSWPANAMYNDNKIDAQKYFEGIQTKYSAANWANIYNNIKDYM